MFSRLCILGMSLLLLLPAAARTSERPFLLHGQADSAKITALPLSDRHVDTLDTHITERNQRLYDSIASKTRRKAVPRLLYRLLFVRNQLDTASTGSIYDETRLLAPYKGKIINDIRIVREEPFSKNGNWIERTGNKLHVLTREGIIRRDLMFKAGDRFNPELIVRSQQLLLSRPYISDTDISVAVDPLDTTRVDVILHTRDSWSISVDGALYSDKRMMVGLRDVNILGTGNRFKVETNFSRRDFTYGGNVLGYEMPNILGSFLTFQVEAGRNFYEDILLIGAHKEFLKPTDYEAGMTYTNMRSKYYFIERDTSELVKVRDFDVWGGWSRQFRGLNASLYLTGHYNDARFSQRPDVTAELHPALHNRRTLLGGIGLYRERLFTTNMVYGFGTKEYVSTGYKAEIVSGYTWGEFRNSVYVATGFRAGGFRSFGYLTGGFTLSSHIDRATGAWNRSIAAADVLWFSNLLPLRRTRIRQFLALNYTQGWNRKHGYEESIGFTNQNGLQALDQYAVGTTRMVLNTETVVFTPIQPLGFRFTFFGFFDAGTLGYSPNPFRNTGFGSVGLGLRVKNEHLIFGTLQIRLGLAFGRGGLVDSDYFSLSNAKHFHEYRFRPSRPEIAEFR